MRSALRLDPAEFKGEYSDPSRRTHTTVAFRVHRDPVEPLDTLSDPQTPAGCTAPRTPVNIADILDKIPMLEQSLTKLALEMMRELGRYLVCTHVSQSFGDWR